MIKFYKGLKNLYSLDLYGSGIYFATDTLEIIHNGKSYSGVQDKVVKDVTWSEGSIIITYSDNTTTTLEISGLNFDRVFSYKGSVLTYEELPLNAKIGDVYNIENAFVITSTNLIGDTITKEYLSGTNVAWNGESWDPLSGSIDLSEYATKLTVEELQQKVVTLQTTVEDVAVKSVKESDKVLVLTEGVLSTNITLEYDQEKQKLQLCGSDNAVISEVNIELTAGSGLKKDLNTLSVKLDETPNNKLTISEEGLLVDISDDLIQLVSTVDEKITTAFEWQDIN